MKPRTTFTWALPTMAVATLCTGLAADVTNVGASAVETSAEVRVRDISIAAIDAPVAAPTTTRPDARRAAPQPIGTCTGFESDFESPTYTLGPIAGQNGWVGFAGASPDSNIVSNANPADGAQHLRNILNEDQGPGVTNMVRNDNCLPGATSFSVDLYLSNKGGADYRIQPQAPTQEFLTAQVLFTFTGNIILLDEIDGTLQFVDTGAEWVCGEYKQFAMVMDNDANTIEYYYDGELIYTGIVFAGTIIEHVILGSDNFHLNGEFGDFDNLVAPADIKQPGPTCVGDLNDDNVVNVSDLLILLGAWGACPGCDADLNNDGVVNVSDLLILLGAWGACPAALGGGDVEGACCIGETCSILTEADCEAANGTFGGECTTCDQVQCEDATTCSGAQSIALGQTVTVDTTGFPVGSAPTCGSALSPNGPTAWYKVTGNGTTFIASTCGSQIGAGTNVAVYCGFTCDDLVCNDGSNEDFDCFDNPFNGTAIWCAQDGVEYYIAVWGDNAAGVVELQLTSTGSPCTTTIDCGGPVCIQPDENCQDAVVGGTYATSDTLSGFKVAEDFQAGESGQITNVCWNGAELGFIDGAFASCPNVDGEGHPFRVTYYADAGGIPGAVIGGPFTANPEFEKLDELSFGGNIAGLFRYSFDHDAVSVNAGDCYWVEIVKVTPEGGCRHLWGPSSQGNGRYAQVAETGNYEFTSIVEGTDRNFCVNIELGDPNDCVPTTGACCTGDSCLGLIGEAECLENCGAVWLQGQQCSSCVLPTTACANTIAGTGPFNCVNGTRPAGAAGGWNFEQGIMKDARIFDNESITSITSEYLVLAGNPQTIKVRIYDLDCQPMSALDANTAVPLLDQIFTIGVDATRTTVGNCGNFAGNPPVHRWTVTLSEALNLPPGNYGVWFSFDIGDVAYFMSTGGSAPNPTSAENSRVFGINNTGAAVNGATTQQSSFCLGN